MMILYLPEHKHLVPSALQNDGLLCHSYTDDSPLKAFDVAPPLPHKRTLRCIFVSPYRERKIEEGRE